MAEERNGIEREANNEESRRDRYIAKLRQHIDLNAIATFLLVAVGICGIFITRNVLEITERAWITPMGANLRTPIKAGTAINFTVSFRNTGKEPATDTNVRTHSSTMDAYDPAFTDMMAVKAPENNSCDGLDCYILESKVVTAGTEQVTWGNFATCRSGFSAD